MNEISIEEAKKGLKTLGVHPILLKYTYLELDLSGKGLTSTEVCESFLSIVYLNISSNQITTLKNLEKINCLVQLKASNNQLSSLDFNPPHCTHHSPTSDGHHAIGSMLTLVDLSENQIEQIGSNFKHHPFIECLFLKGNKITLITGLEELKFLKILDLSYNFIQSIQGLNNLNIRELNLEGNKLTTLDGLSALEKLTALNVSKNLIESLSPIKKCLNLAYLDASDNRILQIKEVAALKKLEWLNILILQGNPCFSKDYYRLRVLFRLPKLKRLDLINVSFEEIIRANNLYKSEEGDLPLRERVFAKYLPRDEFVDYSSQQLPFDDEGASNDSVGESFDGDAGTGQLGEESSMSLTLSQTVNKQAEADPIADDNSSQASINQEKISDLPSLASMRKKPQSLSSGILRPLSAPLSKSDNKSADMSQFGGIESGLIYAELT